MLNIGLGIGAILAGLGVLAMGLGVAYFIIKAVNSND